MGILPLVVLMVSQIEGVNGQDFDWVDGIMAGCKHLEWIIPCILVVGAIITCCCMKKRKGKANSYGPSQRRLVAHPIPVSNTDVKSSLGHSPNTPVIETNLE